MYRLPLFNKEYIGFLESFEKAIIAQGYSGGRGNIPRLAREFLFFLEAKKIDNIKDVQTSDIIEYYEYLLERPNMNWNGGLSADSIRKHIRAARFLFEHLISLKVMDSTPCAIPRLPPLPVRERISLTEEEVQLLYKVCRDQMDRAILACAYGCGMRRSELANLNVTDVVFAEKQIAIRKSKSCKSRSVPMAEGVMKDLKEFLIHERPKRKMYGFGPPTNAFFLNRSGKRMADASLNVRFLQLVKLTGDKILQAKKPTIHILRHSIATQMLNRGADAKYVRSFLGHVLLDTTVGIYGKRRKLKTKLYKLFQKHLEGHNLKDL